MMEQSDGRDAGARASRRHPVRWIALVISMLVLMVAVAATALAVFQSVSAASAREMDVVADDRATGMTLALDGYLSRAAQSLDTTLVSTIKAYGSSGTPAALDAQITAATGASYSMIIYPYGKGAAESDPSLENIAAGNTDGAVAEAFQGYIGYGTGEPATGVGDALGEGPELFAGRSFRLNRKTGYVLISKPLGLRTFGGMRVSLVGQGTRQQQALHRGAVELHLDSLDTTDVAFVQYVESGPVPTMYFDLEDWGGAGAGRIVLTPAPESPQARTAREARPYVLAVLASLAVGLPLGVVTAAIFARAARRTTAST